LIRGVTKRCYNGGVTRVGVPSDKEKLMRDIERFRAKAIELGAEAAAPIRTRLIVVRDRVRLKCRYGCGAYGKRLTCPPYNPTPEETRRLLSEYEIALLVKFGPCVECGHKDAVNIHKAIFELER